LTPVDTPTIYQVKVTLDGVRPVVWRRFQVSADTTLLSLHNILQVVMGWENVHLFAFHVDYDSYSSGMTEGRAASSVTLGQVIPRVPARFDYEYDFGDRWEHEIAVEKALPPLADAVYPRCVAGKRACPPEDCGGPPGYMHLLRVLASPRHPDRRELRRWVGRSFDPAAFDIDRVNAGLVRYRRQA
jgi:hypothetical protein